ncbi:phenylalanine--tRNA ligase subunit beta [bacterium]|nr:phenylalanine--tRNA ligase subunit beta [bacterium]
MKLPIGWVSEFVRLTAADRARLARRLTETGVEIAGEEEIEGDRVLEVEITPNRGDLLSVWGMAREISAVMGVRLCPPAVRRMTVPKKRGFIQIDRGSGCRRYLGARIDGARIGPSPEWAVRKLRQAGYASFNNAVDVTNLILAELGQPLHVFDADKLGESIHVRRSRPGEKIAALDGNTYSLADDLVITAGRPVALAGVIGGLETSVSETTRNIFLECAWFEPSTVRRTCRRLGLATESSFRFERSVDPAGLERAFHRAIELIEELTGGNLEWVEAEGRAPDSPSAIRLSVEDIDRLMGVSVPPASVRKFLAATGCRVASSGAGRWRVVPPSFRPDLRGPHDLVEEVSRLYGMDRIPSRIPAMRPAERSDHVTALDRVRRSALSQGLTETVQLSFVDEKSLRGFGISPADAVALQNPLSLAASHLRPTLLPGLLATLSLNIRREAGVSIRLFETGAVFLPGAPLKEELRLGVVISGEAAPPHFSRPARPVDFLDLKAIIMAILADAGRALPETVFLPAAVGGLDPSACAAIRVGDVSIGCMGLVSEEARKTFDLSQPAFAAEISLSRVLSFERAAVAYAAIPRFPSIRRDLSLVVGQAVTAGDVCREVRAAGLSDLVHVDVFDLYRGDNLPAGAYALGVSLRFQSPVRSLSDEEANRSRDAALARLERQIGARLR